MRRQIETCRVCGADFRPVRFDALVCTPTCAKRLQRGGALAYLEGEPARSQRAARACHDARDEAIAAGKVYTAIVRKNRAARRAIREDKLRQQSEQHAAAAKQHAVNAVLADAMRAQIAKENAAEIVKRRSIVASAVKLFTNEQRNDISTSSVFEWINGTWPDRYTIDEIAIAMASLDAVMMLR
jgi:hypothetical protein